MRDSNDPRLTAYVLGELSLEEREELEAELDASPSGKEALRETERAIEWMRAGLRAQPAIGLGAEQTRRILNTAGQRTYWSRSMSRWAAGLFAAAALVTILVLGFRAMTGPGGRKEVRQKVAVSGSPGERSHAVKPQATSVVAGGQADKPAPDATPAVAAKKQVGEQVVNKPKSRDQIGSDFRNWLDRDVRYIVSPEERSVFRKLRTDSERKEFIEQFWYRRDPNPATALNEFKEEHYRRIAWADQRYSAGIPGWMTDRGRIYIMYGPPTRLESHPTGGGGYSHNFLKGPRLSTSAQMAGSSAKNRVLPPLLRNGGTTSTFPFEVWQYDSLPGIGKKIELEFVDPSMSGDYRLSLVPEDKEALFMVPGSGLTLTEERGISGKSNTYFFAGGDKKAKPQFSVGNRESLPAGKPKFVGTPAPAESFREPSAESNTEAYDRIDDNAFASVKDHPLSTFSIDVDTASYSNVRSFLDGGQLPPRDAVRIEELLNYFRYDYPQPVGDMPFAADLEAASAPWQRDHRLVRIGIKAKEIDLSHRVPANLVFLIDVSGSMQSEEKLPLLQRALRLLVDQLGASDRVSIVVYAGASGLVLPSTRCSDKQSIVNAVERLQAHGSTNGAAGIDLAYQTAMEHFDAKAVNRVILATDGDFNVGVTNQGDLTRMIEERARQGVFLTVLGFGMGNYKDSTLETLADRGNGNYAYIDTFEEAKKVLVEELGGTLVTVAKDVKIQVEFNPALVSAYRLIGYEDRLLADEDFNDDKKDAGEIGAGLTVTALYEVVPRGVPVDIPEVDPLKYQTARMPAASRSPELLTVKIRYKQPDGNTSGLLEFPLIDRGAGFESASTDFRFAAAVASFGMLLRDSPHKGTGTLDALISIAERSIGPDPGGYRWDFVRLARQAQALSPTPPVPGP